MKARYECVSSHSFRLQASFQSIRQGLEKTLKRTSGRNLKGLWGIAVIGVPGVKSLGEFYLNTLTKENDIDWIFLSPAANLGNLEYGKRTGKYRVGKDDLLVDEKGDSFISVEDYAVAMLDELENPKHHKERFTVAY